MENKTVHLHLFSEMDEDTGLVVPLEYELKVHEVHILQGAIKNNNAILPFGNQYHHSDDIIKFIIV
jgi:hypothetical protein